MEMTTYAVMQAMTRSTAALVLIGFTYVNDALSNATDVNGDVVFTIGTDIITIEDTTITEITDNLII